MIAIDGSQGEGGGQILRTSLAMSLVTGKPFHIKNIRAGRKKPGLMSQHIASVSAAAKIGGAGVKGNTPGSPELSFSPGGVKPGGYHFAVGTAGSCSLVLQTVLPALLLADGVSELVLEGGTHNPYAPPFDFLEKTFLPLLNRMGPEVSAALERHGFYPAGGGRIIVRIEPARALSRVDILERGAIKRRIARAIVSGLPRSIGGREAKRLGEALSLPGGCLFVEEVKNPRGPGNALVVEVESEHITEVFTGFGEKGVPAEMVAERVASSVREYIGAGVPVGKHLADQLLVPMALAGGGRFRTLPLTLHAKTNMDVIKRFLDVEAVTSEIDEHVREVEIRRA